MAKVVKPKKIEKESLWKSSRTFREIVTWVFEILAAIAIAALFTAAFCYSVPVQDSSMAPTLMTGDRILINRLSGRIGKVSRGDLVAYQLNNSLDSAVHVKRVIGLPGDKIQIRDGLVVINDETYIEDSDYPSMINAGLAAEPVTLGQNEYFLLGDNRNDSQDSRFADVGNLSKSELIGEVWFRFREDEHPSFVH